MKASKKNRISILLLLWIVAVSINSYAQDSAAKAEPAVNLHYFVNSNAVPYLIVESVLKNGKKSTPLPRKAVKIYLDSSTTENIVSNINTDGDGKAKAIIPVALKDQWNSSAGHKFIAILDGSTPEDERTTTLEITKAKMEIDTSSSDGVRSINVKVLFLENDEWVPAKEVEMKVGVSRLDGSILSSGEEESYTTDSTGIVVAEFKRDSLPGDHKGNLILVASIDDNDLFGNIRVEKTVPWGIAWKADTGFFDQRTLWSTRFRTPLWLLLMAYTIVIP